MIEQIKKYSTFESMIEIDDTNEGVYVLTLHDIHNIVNEFTDVDVTEDLILNELQNYKFVKVENPEIKEIENVDELSSDDENPTFIKKFEMT